MKIELITLQGFQSYKSNQRIEINNRVVPIADVWMKHHRRRTYDRIVFEPGSCNPKYYNMWRGWPINPIQGDCSKIFAHIRDNICRGNNKTFLWVQAWMASIIQHPTKKNGTSLCVRGRQGTGKSIFAKYFGSLFGQHYVVVSGARYITGQFNSHLADCLLLHSEEGFWAGDKASEGKLKDLVTGSEQLIEYKGKEPIRVKNHIRLLVTGNPDWIVPAGLEERRFAVLEISNAHMQDQRYFEAIAQEMENGGKEALMYHLLNFDLSQVNIYDIPKTDALLEQKIASMSDIEKWWYDMLSKGMTPGYSKWEQEVRTQAMFESYKRHSIDMGERWRSQETKMGKALKRLIPGIKKEHGFYKSWNDDTRNFSSELGIIYILPPLEECRKAFEQIVHQQIDWDDPHDPAAEIM